MKKITLVLCGILLLSACGENYEASKLISQAKQAEKTYRWDEAKKLYQEVVEKFPNSKKISLANQGIENANSKIEDINEAFALANVAAEAGKQQEAIDIFNKLSEKVSDKNKEIIKSNINSLNYTLKFLEIVSKIYSSLPDGCSLGTTECLDNNYIKRVLGKNYTACNFTLKTEPIFGSDKKTSKLVCRYYSSDIYADRDISVKKTYATSILISNDPIIKQGIIGYDYKLNDNENVILVGIILMDAKSEMELYSAYFVYDSINDMIRKL